MIRMHTEGSCLLVKLSGALRDSDVEALVESLRKDPRNGESDALYDCREVTDVTGLSVEMIRRLAHMQSESGSDASRKFAAVAEQDALYGLLRMLQGMGEAIRPGLQVHRELEPALEYLGLAPETARLLDD